MNYLVDLTKEEIKYVCSVIPYQETALYFKKYPKEFTKLRPGFRVKTLSEDMVTRTLYEFRTKDFIASYIIKHIDRWINEIDEEIKKAKEKGFDLETSYIYVLSRSYFAENIKLFFKIKGEEKSEDYLNVLSSAVEYEAEKLKKEEEERDSTKKKLSELDENQKELKQQLSNEQKKLKNLMLREKKLSEKLEQSSRDLTEEKERCKKIADARELVETELKKAKDDEVWKSAEMQQKIDVLSSRLREQAELVADYEKKLSELETKIFNAEEEVATWKNHVRTREQQIFKFKAERAMLLTDQDANQKQIKELKEALEQALNVEKVYKEQIALLQSEKKANFEQMIIEQKHTETVSKKDFDYKRHMPMCPEDMDDFSEYFNYNLENIGFDQNVEGASDFLDYVEKIVFQGIPLLIKRAPGINIANALANTLYGVPFAARMLYTEDANIQKIEKFLMDTPDRVVCIDGFVGNCNLMELIPVLEQHRNKIIILTYMFDKTLTYVPNEILAYVHFVSADVFDILLKIKDITEDPSEIKEKPFANNGYIESDVRLQKIFRDIACECGIETSTSFAMSEMIEEENQLNEMLMFTLLPYVLKVGGKNPYNCSKRLQRYAGENGRCLKKDTMMRWFG